MSRGELDRAFHPRCVAVVGDKMGNGYVWLRSMSTFRGKVYSVQIDPQELPGIERLGIENYSSILEIPEPVDYVVVAVPRSAVPTIVGDCITKGVGGAAIFTSGFSETNTEEGRQLEDLLVEMAKETSFNIIGPNCMGIFNPKIGVRHDVNQYHGEAGPVGFISQSGTHAIFFSLLGASNGIRISKSVSYGNGAVLDSTDYLEYLAQDRETEIIGMYIEGVKDGARFLQCLSETTRKKPVLVWKGGKGDEGYRAISCHTGSMASSPTVWRSIIRQCGAIEVDNLNQMIDCVKALLYLKAPLGPSVALVAQSGGQSVVIADAFAQAGLVAPMLSHSSYKSFASFFNIIGGNYLNPLDISWHAPSIDDSIKILNILSTDDNVDSLVLELSLPFLSQIWEYFPSYVDTLIDALGEFKDRCPKSVMVVVSSGQLEAEALEIRNRLIDKGVPSFPDFERAAGALKRVTEYYKSQRDGD
jgi:acyl-CoA synthetase (NDP forming)